MQRLSLTNNLCTIVRVIKYRRKKWAADIASIGETKRSSGTRKEIDNRGIILKLLLKK